MHKFTTRKRLDIETTNARIGSEKMRIYLSTEDSSYTRCCERYHIEDGAVALLDCAIPFHIIDISKQGLAFRYVGLEKWFEDPREIDISYDGLCLKNITVQTVSDLQMVNGVIQTRRHSVMFENMSASQASQLEQFILKHAVQADTDQD